MKSSTPLILPIRKLTMAVIHDSILNREPFAALHSAAKVPQGVSRCNSRKVQSFARPFRRKFEGAAGDQISAATFKLSCKLRPPSPVISWTRRPPISRPKLLLRLVTRLYRSLWRTSGHHSLSGKQFWRALNITKQLSWNPKFIRRKEIREIWINYQIGRLVIMIFI